MRYDNRLKAINAEEQYEELFKERGVKQIRQYTTPKLTFPTAKEIDTLERIRVVWKHGDKLWKMAEQYYGDPKLWWIIGQFNKKPTDAHIAIGDVIIIPLPLEKILAYTGY